MAASRFSGRPDEQTCSSQVFEAWYTAALVIKAEVTPTRIELPLSSFQANAGVESFIVAGVGRRTARRDAVASADPLAVSGAFEVFMSESLIDVRKCIMGARILEPSWCVATPTSD